MEEISEVKKILFVIPSFGGGGAERVCLNLLKGLNRERFKPEVVVFYEENAYEYDIPKDLRIRCLFKRKALDFFRLVYLLSKIIRKEKPQLIVSFLTYTNYLTIIARMIARTDVPIIVSEHTHLSRDLSFQRFKFIKKKLVRYLYPKAECIITVSKGVKEDLHTNFGIPEDRCIVIYNPLDIDLIREKIHDEVDHPWFKEDVPIIIACGRLTLEKNYPLLLKGIKKVLKRINVRLIIIGEGEKRLSLESLTTSLGIEKNVAFLGFKQNPFKYIARANLFVLSSLYEAFGNVVLEAMACGVPVISTRCPSGPDEIITDGVNGLLVPVGDEDALAEAILRLLGDKELRQRLAKAGKKRAEDFRIEKIIAEYERVFEEVIRCSVN
ncbi:MAG: glycosyltransferase [Thermodesulfovibrionales bacterium]